LAALLPRARQARESLQRIRRPSPLERTVDQLVVRRRQADRIVSHCVV